MDRNIKSLTAPQQLLFVALRKESVDRNGNVLNRIKQRFVALRKESVDRNVDLVGQCRVNVPSLSARRAWIEMHRGAVGIQDLKLSLSARRAWIEMPQWSVWGCKKCCRSPQGERG